jgi:hypothetical protein
MKKIILILIIILMLVSFVFANENVSSSVENIQRSNIENINISTSDSITQECPVYKISCVNGIIDWKIDENGCKIPMCIEESIMSESVKCVFYNTNKEQTCYSTHRNKEYSQYQCTAQPSSSGMTTCTIEVKGNKGEKLEWKSSCGGYAYTIIDGISEYAEFKCEEDPIEYVSEEVKCIIWNAVGKEECYSEKGSCIVNIYDTGKTNQFGSCVVSVIGDKGETVTWKSSCGGYAYTIMDGKNEYAEFKCENIIDDCVCTREYSPVCGINGQTYSNACLAKCARIEIAYSGECKTNEESYMSAKWTCSNGKDFYEESKSCQTYSYWRELARRTCATYDNVNCKIVEDVSNVETGIIVSRDRNIQQNNDTEIAEIISTNVPEETISITNPNHNLNSEITVCKVEVVTNFAVGDPCKVNCEKYEENGCIIKKCDNGTIERYCYDQCPSQGIDEIRAIKERCSLAGGETIVSINENGCNYYECSLNRTQEQVCEKEENIPREKILRCKENGGEIITRTDDNGCLVLLQCVGEKIVEKEIRKEIINDQTKILELAIKLEGLRIDLKQTINKLNSIANYYEEINDPTSQNFRDASDLLENAVQKIDSVKQYLKDNVSNFTEENAREIVNVITTIRNEILRDVLLKILG